MGTLSGFVVLTILGCILTASVLVFSLYSVLVKQWRKENPNPGLDFAKKICAHSQYVRKVDVWESGMIVLELRDDSDDMNEAILYFPTKHPDFPELAELNGFQNIHFTLRSKPVKGITTDDPVAFLSYRS